MLEHAAEVCRHPYSLALCRFIFISGHVLGSDCEHGSSNWILSLLFPPLSQSGFAPFFSHHFVTFAANHARMPCANERMGKERSRGIISPCLDDAPKREPTANFGIIAKRESPDFSVSKVSVNYLTYISATPDDI